ncbi:phosphoribosylanthranilate isomerase [Paludisphaera mucosa]|uniref:N-(5'-phosphoribosyl)anthranilate isomerase n=1 Tax=Paludisphaera mucosa TaxID=3030827 RepID=A0ABT6FHV2_9BACT|nr:phosphoribosylanthranilate isomerase [Paludisphaera mucosa]MDG3007171.1 phosphoribosylanthranilate isomerase [Paludisphaera mucosa]
MPLAADPLFRGSPGIKVCGLTDPAEAVACLAAGVDWIGLNFHPPSPRSLTIDRAGAILSACPRPDAAVGLFVDRPPAEVVATCRTLGLSRVQLHGDEPPEDLSALGEFFLIRAFRLRDASAVRAMSAHLERASRLGRAPDAVLIDAWSPSAFGGTGATITASILVDLPPIARLMLAGGLTPENVAARALAIRPWMVDLASGVESAPGRKDLDKVQSLVRALRPVPA